MLTAFALGQLRLTEVDSYPGLWLNTLGAGILPVLALHDSQWGFLALEGIWALVAGTGLVRRVRTSASSGRATRQEGAAR